MAFFVLHAAGSRTPGDWLSTSPYHFSHEVRMRNIRPTMMSHGTVTTRVPARAKTTHNHIEFQNVVFSCPSPEPCCCCSDGTAVVDVGALSGVVNTCTAVILEVVLGAAPVPPSDAAGAAT